MSKAEYDYSLTIGHNDDLYYGLIMAAMRGADSENAAKLRAAWPEVWAELEARYNAPAGLLPGEYDYAEGIRRLEDGRIVDIEIEEESAS